MEPKLDPSDASDEDLRRSTWYLAQAQRVAHVGYWDRDLDAGSLTLSDESCRIFGLPPQRHVELAQWHEQWLRLIHPEDRPKIAEAAAVALRGGPPYDVEYRVIRPGGDMRVVRSRAEVTFDAMGRPRRMFGVMQDITDLRRAEERLREVSERFRAMAESSLVGIYLVQESAFRYVNPAMARMFGYSVEELVDRVAPAALVHPDDFARVATHFRRRAEGESDEVRQEFRGVRKDGSVFPVEVHGRRIDVDGERAVMGVLLDDTERSRAERELRRSQTYLAEAQRMSRTGSFGWEPSRGITWSEETYRIFGMDPATPPTIALVLERTHPDDRTAVEETIRRAEEEGTGFDLEHRVLMPDGSLKHLHVVARAVTVEPDRREFAGAVMDVTAQKHAEEERRAHIWFLESMDRVHRAIQATDDLERMIDDVLDEVLAIFDCDRATLGTYSGEPEPTSFRITGIRTRSGFAADLVRGFEGPIDEELRVIPRALKAARGPVQFTASTDPPLPRVLAERFAFRSMLGMAVFPHVADPARFHHFTLAQCSRERVWAPHEMRLFHEIGRRLDDAVSTLATLRDLRQSESRFRTLFDFAADAFMIHDDTGAVADANRQACESLGYAREELIGKAVADFDADFDGPTFERLKERVIAGETVTFETRLRRKDGTVFPVEVRTRLVPQLDRLFSISTARDITERKRGEEERERLRQAEADLARISRVTTMGEFTASLAHEIRQPVAAAITNAKACIRWLDRERPDLREAREAAARIVADANRVADIVSRVRALYKNDAPRHERVDLNDVVRETLALLRSEASRHAVSIRVQLAPELPPAMGDRVQLQQVLVNLILNGFEATGGAPAVLRIESARGREGDLLVVVSDEGVGLPEGTADRIFDAFFTTKPQGTGMGLAISRSIIERHGGRLWATPAQPRGTSFHVSLPPADATE